MDEKIIQELTRIFGKKKQTAMRYALNTYLVLRRFELEQYKTYFTPSEIEMIKQAIVSKITNLDPELILASDHSKAFQEKFGDAGGVLAKKLYEIPEISRYFLIESMFLKRG
jgi:hypothetical protein